jgi:hypothetical protein
MSIICPHILTDEQAKEFQRLYLQKCGEKLSLEEAKEYGHNLGQFLAMIRQIKIDMYNEEIAKYM